MTPSRWTTQGNFVVVVVRLPGFQVHGRIGYGAEFQVGTSDSIPTSGGRRAGRKVRGGLDRERRWLRARHLRPALRSGWGADRWRIPGQHVHDGVANLAEALDGDAAGDFVARLGSNVSGNDNVLGQRFTAAVCSHRARNLSPLSPIPLRVSSESRPRPRVSRAAAGGAVRRRVGRSALADGDIACPPFRRPRALPSARVSWVNTYTDRHPAPAGCRHGSRRRFRDRRGRARARTDRTTGCSRGGCAATGGRRRRIPRANTYTTAPPVDATHRRRSRRKFHRGVACAPKRQHSPGTTLRVAASPPPRWRWTPRRARRRTVTAWSSRARR